MASFGGAGGSTESQTKSSSTQANTYAPGQTALQTQLGSALSTNLGASQAGTMTPGVMAQKTAAADTINKNSAGLLDRVNSYLAQSGFGKSGATGKAAVQSELGRQSALGANEANFAQVQQGVNTQNLLAALNYAFQSLGQTASGVSTGTSSGWSLGGGVGTSYLPGGGK